MGEFGGVEGGGGFGGGRGGGGLGGGGGAIGLCVEGLLVKEGGGGGEGPALWGAEEESGYCSGWGTHRCGCEYFWNREMEIHDVHKVELREMALERRRKIVLMVM